MHDSYAKSCVKLLEVWGKCGVVDVLLIKITNDNKYFILIFLVLFNLCARFSV